METLFILIGLFFGGQAVDVRIIDTYGGSRLCNEYALQLNERAKAEQKPYQFYCRAAKFTAA